LLNTPVNHCKRSIVPRSTAKRTSKSSPVAPLNSAWRLLLTLVRSDWDQLERLQEQWMRSMETGATKKEVPFFPSILTLGDIYNRIQGSTSHTNRVLLPASDEPSLLTSLPMDILQERLAPFLNAREVAAVRSTSMHFYWSLRSVVPGLKLRLYTHQVNSLFWMRQREASLIKTEADCFGTKEDIHRDVTGGASVRLASNPATGPSKLCVLLDPWTGLEIFRDEAWSEFKKLPRRVACGGLLCDDPGLGKTITVLALILQTYQPRSGPPKRRVPLHNYIDDDDEDSYWDADSCLSMESTREIRDDKLFYTYWEEQVEVDFRRPALLKLVNDFCKKLSNSGRFPLPRIQKDVAADVFGSDFAAFQSSVEYVSFILFHQVLFQMFSDVFSFFRNAIYEAYGNDPMHYDHPLSTFLMLVQNFKKREVYSIRKSFSNESYKPNSRVAAVLSEQNEKRILHRMIPSPGTLLVVPSVLIEHWKVCRRPFVCLC
jgi:SNF2-related domain